MLALGGSCPFETCVQQYAEVDHGSVFQLIDEISEQSTTRTEIIRTPGSVETLR